jgi:hypothetical protein
VGRALKARNELKKKYPLIISDERVLASHLNLMTLSKNFPFIQQIFKQKLRVFIKELTR